MGTSGLLVSRGQREAQQRSSPFQLSEGRWPPPHVRRSLVEGNTSLRGLQVLPSFLLRLALIMSSGASGFLDWV